MSNADMAGQGQVRLSRLTWIGFGLGGVSLAIVIAMHVIGWKDSWMLWGVVLMNVGNSCASVFRLQPRAQGAVSILGIIIALAGIVATVMGY